MKPEAKRVRAVKVCRKRYRVQYKTLKGYYGYAVQNPACITVHPEQSSAEMAETLLHEIMHTIWWKDLKHRTTEEHAVTKLAHGLVVVARDNPGLLSHIETLVRETS